MTKSTIHPLNSLGPVAKLNRARKHLDELRIQIQEYMSRKPYSTIIERYPERNEAALKLSITKHPALVEWAVIIGDTAHNLRSSLDLLACSLVRLEDSNADVSQVAFPIFRNFDTFTDKFSRKVTGMHDDAIELIKNLKPYGGGNDMFYAISELDNIDKHRLLVATFGLPRALPFSISQGVPGEHTVRIYPQQGFLIEDNSTVAIIKDVTGILPEVKVDGDIALSVMFAEPEQVANIDVLKFFNDAVNLVDEVIKLFDRLVVSKYSK